MLSLDDGRFTEVKDSYGFTWLTRTTTSDDIEGLVTDLHGVNNTSSTRLSGKRCFAPWWSSGTMTTGTLGLVYLFKRGTWFPYAPTAAGTRDSALELQIRAVVADDQNIEPHLSRWFALQGAPGL